MKLIASTLALSLILTACGGGGSGTPEAAAAPQTKEQFLAEACSSLGGYTDGRVMPVGNLTEQDEDNEKMEHIDGHVYTKYRIWCVNPSPLVIDGHQIWPIDAYYSHVPLPDRTEPTQADIDRVTASCAAFGATLVSWSTNPSIGGYGSIFGKCSDGNNFQMLYSTAVYP